MYPASGRLWGWACRPWGARQRLHADQFLTANGISTYTLTSDVAGAKIQSVYDDFNNMGRIFGKEERAAEIIAQMKAKIDPVSGHIRYLGFVWELGLPSRR